MSGLLPAAHGLEPYGRTAWEGAVLDHSKECQSPLHVTQSCAHQLWGRENKRPPLAHGDGTEISEIAFECKLRLAGQLCLKSSPELLGQVRVVARIEQITISRTSISFHR